MNPKIKWFIPWLVLFTAIILIFQNWFTFAEIATGDAAFYFKSTAKDLTFLPYVWATRGLGEFSPLLYPFFYLIFPVKILSSLDIPWFVTERVSWYWPFIFLSVFSSWFLIKTVLPAVRFRFLAPLIYLTNSYILMIIGGGQISIALSYALAPLVTALFIKSIRANDFSSSIIFGLTAAIQVGLEPRIASITLIFIIPYAFLHHGLKPQKYIRTILIPLILILGLHFYWILPSLLSKKTTYNPNFIFSDWVGFLSFAQFSNSLSLLHPLWPDNVFGKLQFMRPEFLGIPIFAFLALFFINEKSKSQLIFILYFAFWGIIGAYLAKGVNPPFGEVFSWSFKNLTGINMFRDPTKFYVLIALSYSILIPFGLDKLARKLSNIKIINPYYLIPIFFIIFWLLLIRPAWMGQLGGTFKGHIVSAEYSKLENFLDGQSEFFRILWVPRKQNFGFFSDNHPALYSSEFVSPDICRLPLCSLADQNQKPEKFDPLTTSESQILDKVRKYSLSYFNNPEAFKILSQMGVKYVVVPYDSEGEIFLRDRKYSNQERQEYIAFLDSIPWLKRIDGFEKIAIYQTPEFKNHFWLKTAEESPLISWKKLNPTRYEIEIKNLQKPSSIIFSEQFDSSWVAKIGNQQINSKEFNSLNEFSVNKFGDTLISIEYLPQKYVWWGLPVSLGTLVLALILIIKLRGKSLI